MHINHHQSIGQKFWSEKVTIDLMRVAKPKKQKQCVRSPVTNQNLPSKQKLQKLIYIYI